MKFTTSFIILTCAFVAQASTTANVLSDLSTINTDVTNLDSQIKAFPNSGGSLTNALVRLAKHPLSMLVELAPGHP